MGRVVYSDSIVEKLLLEELRLVNRHMPITRVSLAKLLAMEFPHVVLRDGSVHFFKKRELEKLLRYVKGDEVEKLLLPIVITMRPDIGEGVGLVDDAVAARVLSRILGLEREEDRLYLYKPQLAILREQFDTVIQFAISINLGEDEILKSREGVDLVNT